MGKVADKERDASESSGMSDMMDVAASLGLEDDDVASAGVTRADDDEADDELEDVGAGYGGAAAAALIADASLEPEPATAANAAKSASTSQVSRAEPPPPPAPAPKAATPPPAPSASTSSGSSPKVAAAKAVSKPVPVVPAAAPKAAPKASSSVAGAPVAVAASGAQPPQEKKGSSMLLIGAGVLALGVVGWFVFNNNSNVKDHPTSENEVRTAASTPVEPPPPKPAPVVQKAPEPPPVEEPVIDATTGEPEPPPVEEAKVEVSVKQKKRDKTEKPETGEKEPPTKAAPEPKQTQAEIDEKFRTECLLNPSKPGCDELRRKQRDTTDLDAKLADKLTQSQIREGFAKAKGKAKACGGETGVVVRVKASIAGSGELLSVNALDEHAGTALGTCVENALKDAKFARFSGESQGTVYPVTF